MVFLVTPHGSVGSVATLVVALIRDFQPSYLCAPPVACVNLMPLDVLTLRVECSLTLKIRHLISKYPDSFGQRPDLGLLLKYCEHFKNSSNHGHFGQSRGSTQVDYSSLLLSTPWRYALRWPHFWEWLGRIASNLMKTSLRVNQGKIFKNSQCWNQDFAQIKAWFLGGSFLICRNLEWVNLGANLWPVCFLDIQVDLECNRLVWTAAWKSIRCVSNSLTVVLSRALWGSKIAEISAFEDILDLQFLMSQG